MASAIVKMIAVSFYMALSGITAIKSEEQLNGSNLVSRIRGTDLRCSIEQDSLACGATAIRV
jgi:hypothetical protein